MGAAALVRLLGTIGVVLAASRCASTAPDEGSVWGSDQASLTISGDGATLQILASGGCFGSYGAIAQPIPGGTFNVSGTYTQLMGVYPGKAEYPAQFSGVVSGRQMTITATVPALQQSFGPFRLTQGDRRNWAACLYP